MTRMLMFGCCVALAEPVAAQTLRRRRWRSRPRSATTATPSSGDGCSAACVLENASALLRRRRQRAPAPTLDAVRVASGLSQPVHVTAPPLDPEPPLRRRADRRDPHRRRTACCCRRRSSTSPAASAPASEQGLLERRLPPRLRGQPALLRLLHRHARQHRDRRRYEASATNPNVADPSSERVLLTIAAAVRQPQRRPARLRPRRLPLRRHGRRRRRRATRSRTGRATPPCSASCCASTSTSRAPPFYAVPPTTRTPAPARRSA